ncbi:class A beta-lactamase, subclass A2 [Pseudoalteromonas phenolica]|uniref:beta-lactamase n=1 Tax=Pseudoalteromonas phenolica TaxID=161398 RepID=A0A0S2K7Z9_9GAMM|nr:class A beta-lactamase, subclass A2 [Pseudoalteromonas phenolica]ALO44438.1 Beta-lactamase [Pseudoalteromonas phenolica]MBE0357454.1 beta-lactamase class A [Pseudoalteromonas phenolica O-BC30]
MRSYLLVAIIVCLLPWCVHSKPIDTLKADIELLLDSKRAKVGVSIWDQNAEPVFSFNGDSKLPMQSVFKFHIAAAVLSEVDKGKWSLEDKIKITPNDLDNGLWSPIRKKYPTGTELTLSEVIRYTVSVSDNVGCDILLSMLGGPKKLEDYLHQSGIKDIAVIYNEENMQKVWQRQYENWTTANAANTALRQFYINKNLLSDKSHQFLWDVMKGSKTGRKTIRAGVPKDIQVAHKTGHSGKNAYGVTGAQNDIGIVFLPSGQHYYISVLVSDSYETSETNQNIIAKISELTWQFFTNKTL